MSRAKIHSEPRGRAKGGINMFERCGMDLSDSNPIVCSTVSGRACRGGLVTVCGIAEFKDDQGEEKAENYHSQGMFFVVATYMAAKTAIQCDLVFL
jgi:hypothetical protein